MRAAPVILATAVALAGGFSAASRAQPAADPAPGTQNADGILVIGSPDRRDPVSAFVEDVTVETGNQIAKFATPICPLSLGLPRGQSEVIEARVRQVADYLGLGTAGAGCRPNVVVVIAAEGGDFVRQLRRERADLFAALQLPELRDIMRLAGPVRAWQVVEPHGADGRPMERIAFMTVPNGPPMPIANGYRLTGVTPSLTSRPTRQDLSLSFIVFDLAAIEGLSLLQIADHAAMRAFARTDAAGLPARRSILTLFGDRDAGTEPAAELTNWDAAYLRALYRTGNTLTAHQHRANMARSMRRELGAAASGRDF